MVHGLDRGCPAISPQPPRALPSLVPGGNPAALGWRLPDQATRRGRTAGHRAWPDRAHRGDWHRPGAEGRTLFGEYVATEWWPAWKDQHPTSEYGTRKKVEKRILPAFGNIPLGNLDASAIGAWKAAMLAEQLSPAYLEGMLTVGVDLAAEASNTAVAWLDWRPEGAVVRDVVRGVGDDVIVEAVSQADKAGIDCPFGWPESFVRFVSAHRDNQLTLPEDVAGRDWRRQLAFRRTDEAVRAATGLVPLSVAADRIAHPAMRCAGLLARLAREGQPVDRGGSGVVVEVYPAASLKQWGLPHRRYKRPENLVIRGKLVDELLAAADWLTLGRHERECRASDDALDAVIAALTARAAFLGLTIRPSPANAAAARTEGWIMLPASRLRDLAPGLTGSTVQ